MNERNSATEALEIEAPPSTAFEVAPHFNADADADTNAIVSAMLSDHKKLLDKHANLAWSDRRQVKAPNGFVVPTDRRIKKSGFDGRLPYKGPYGGKKAGYYVQNRLIFLGKQKIVALTDVPELIYISERNEEKERVKTPFHLRAAVKLALEITDAEILASDPQRCKICIDFRGSDAMELMAHFRRKHPRELDALVVGIEKLHEDEDAEPEPTVAPPPAAAAAKPKQTFKASTT